VKSLCIFPIVDTKLGRSRRAWDLYNRREEDGKALILSFLEGVSMFRKQNFELKVNHGGRRVEGD